MNRIDMYLDNNGSIVMEFFKTVDSEYSYKKYKGKETYDIIKKIAYRKITDVYESKENDCLLIGYKDLGVNLYEPESLIRKKGMMPLVRSLNDFHEKEELGKIEKKKVTRKNKYNTKRIIAGGLAFISLAAIATGLFKKEEKQTTNNKTSSIVSEIDEEQPETVVVFDEETIKDDEIPVFVEYEDRSGTPKAYETKAWYNDTITKYAKRYGLDPKIVLAIATQERGIHSEIKDVGGATGLMQLQNGVWEDEYITAYNFETKQYEKEYITNDKIKDVFNNIRYGCMYLQNCMEYMNYNTLAAVQCYNMGYDNMMKILKAYSLDTGKSVDEILNDKYDVGWLDYRYIIKEGDGKYVENVFSWVGNDFEIKTQKNDKTLVAITISNEKISKKIY